MKIKITKTTSKQDFEKVYPSIVYNRYDMFCGKGEFAAVKISNNGTEKIVEYKISKDEIELGLWLTPISAEELESLLAYIKKNHQNVKKVLYKNGVIPYGKSSAHNNYRIVFPESAEEMKSRISSDSWHKMRRRNRRAAEKYGEMTLVEYNDGNIPEEIVEKFFEFKLATRNRTYNMTAKEYLERYHVSDCYVVMFGETVGAMHFCCEQCPMVYGENHSYNPELREYSLGKFIFTHSLIRIVEKKHTEIFLGGGDYEYKTHYGSVEETLYDCEIDISEPDKTKKSKASAGGSGMGKIKKFILKKLGIVSLNKKIESLEKENKKLKKKNESAIARLEERNRDNQRRLSELERRCTQLESQITTYRNTLLYLDKRMNQSDKTYKGQISNLETYIFSQNRGLCQTERKPRIIVSITSFPGRISTVPVVLERLLVQTVRPDKIVLWLSKDQFPNMEADLPKDLLDMKECGVEIGWCDGDVKAYKKVLPTLKKYPDDLVIIVDDDLVYRVDFVEKLYSAHLEYPKAIIASRAHQILLGEDGKIAPYEQWSKECDYDTYKVKNDWFFTGGAGTLLPPGVFGEEVFNTELIQEICPYADDIWLNVHAAMKSVPIVSTAINSHLTYIEGTQGDGLYSINKEQNDVQLKKVIDYYKDQLKDSIYKHI